MGNFANTLLPAGAVNLGQNFNTKNETKILNKKSDGKNKFR